MNSTIFKYHSLIDLDGHLSNESAQKHGLKPNWLISTYLNKTRNMPVSLCVRCRKAQIKNTRKISITQESIDGAIDRRNQPKNCWENRWMESCKKTQQEKKAITNKCSSLFHQKKNTTEKKQKTTVKIVPTR